MFSKLLSTIGPLVVANLSDKLHLSAHEDRNLNENTEWRWDDSPCPQSIPIRRCWDESLKMFVNDSDCPYQRTKLFMDCPAIPEPWSQWTACSKACGHGFKTRTRYCPSIGCEAYSLKEERGCNEGDCMMCTEKKREVWLDAHWAEFAVWGDKKQRKEKCQTTARQLAVNWIFVPKTMLCYHSEVTPRTWHEGRYSPGTLSYSGCFKPLTLQSQMIPVKYKCQLESGKFAKDTTWDHNSLGSIGGKKKRNAACRNRAYPYGMNWMLVKNPRGKWKCYLSHSQPSKDLNGVKASVGCFKKNPKSFRCREDHMRNIYNSNNHTNYEMMRNDVCEWVTCWRNRCGEDQNLGQCLDLGFGGTYKCFCNDFRGLERGQCQRG